MIYCKDSIQIATNRPGTASDIDGLSVLSVEQLTEKMIWQCTVDQGIKEFVGIAVEGNSLTLPLSSHKHQINIKKTL